MRDNKDYPSASGVTHLVFSSVQKEDAGKYTCSASNTGGSAQAQVDIVVYCEYCSFVLPEYNIYKTELVFC